MKNIKYEAESVLMDSSGNLKRFTGKLYYDKVRLNNYKWYGKDDSMRIYATYHYDLDIDCFVDTLLCNTPDLLLEMLTLREKLSDSIFDVLDKVKFGFKISDNDLKLICNWCKKNGFPEHIDSESKIKNKKLFSLKEPKQISFSVADFLNRLNDVYKAFLLYKKIIENPCKSPSIQNDKMKFESAFQSIVFTNKICFGKEIFLAVKANDLFDAAFYQLANMLYLPEEQIAICPICHRFFIRKNANQKYCHNTKVVNGIERRTCYAQKMYKRNQSRKESE